MAVFSDVDVLQRAKPEAAWVMWLARQKAQPVAPVAQWAAWLEELAAQWAVWVEELVAQWAVWVEEPAAVVAVAARHLNRSWCTARS